MIPVSRRVSSRVDSPPRHPLPKTRSPGALACCALTAARSWRVALFSQKFASASRSGSSVASSSPLAPMQRKLRVLRCNFKDSRERWRPSDASAVGGYQHQRARLANETCNCASCMAHGTPATHAVDMELLIIFALLVALGPLSLRFGYDSREL